MTAGPQLGSPGRAGRGVQKQLCTEVLWLRLMPCMNGVGLAIAGTSARVNDPETT